MTNKPETKEAKTSALATLDETYLRDNANVGLESISAEDLLTPSLSIIQNTSKAVDSDGRPYPRGKFLYKGDDRLTDTAFVTFLSVTKKDLPNKYASGPQDSPTVPTFILMGALEPDWKPFMLYMKSTGIMTVKQFLTKVKTSQVPLFAHRVQLISEEVKTPKGDYYAIRFNTLGMRKNMDEILMLEEMAKTYGARINNEVEEATRPAQPSDYPEDYSDDGDEKTPF